MGTDLPKPEGVHTDARVELESGRWVVYLDTLMVDEQKRPAGVRTSRISDYHTEKAARVAATWMERAARRRIDDPTGL